MHSSKKLKKHISRRILSKKLITNKNTKKKRYIYTFGYYNGNREITNSKTLEHIKKLRIPPNYKDVHISLVPTDSIQAIGIDDKGRKQYIYNPTFVIEKQNEKYNNMVNLGSQIEQITKDINPLILSADKTENEIGIIIYMLIYCNIRIGNIKYANLYGTYGATTLQRKHITIYPRQINIEFIGKKNVINKSVVYITAENKHFAKALKALLHNKKSDDYIFSVNSKAVASWLEKYDKTIKPKLFRTWFANVYFLDKIRRIIDGPDEVEHKELDKVCLGKNPSKLLRLCFDYVAERLNNSATISKKSYVDFEILNFFTQSPHTFVKYMKNNKTLSTHVLLLKMLKKIRHISPNNKNDKSSISSFNST